MRLGKPKLHFTDKITGPIFLPLIPKFVTPNQITVLRFFLTPIVLILLWLDHYILGMGLFIFAALTDAIDGCLARTRDQITEWGKLYDPLADKLLIGSTIYLLILKYVDIYAAIIIIILEVIIIIGALYQRHKGIEVQANVWGKIKMVLQVFGVCFLFLAIIFDLQSLFPFANGVLYVSIAFATVSLLTHSI